MAGELDQVADHAEAAAAAQHEVARRARVMQRRRADGWSWTKILDREPFPDIFELGRRSTNHMARAARELAQVVTGGLAAEGESRRQIGRRLGVTHQRVSTLVRGQQSSATADGR